MSLTIDPNPSSFTNVTEARRRLRSIREQGHRLDAMLAEAEALDGRGEALMPTLFAARVLLRLAKIDARLAALADEVSVTIAEDLVLSTVATGPADQGEAEKGPGA